MAQRWVSTDASATPKTSPISAGTSEQALKAPATGYRYNLYVYAASAAVTARTTAGSDTASFTIPQATWFAIPTVGGETTYIARPVSTTLDFALAQEV